MTIAEALQSRAGQENSTDRSAEYRPTFGWKEPVPIVSIELTPIRMGNSVLHAIASGSKCMHPGFRGLAFRVGRMASINSPLRSNSFRAEEVPAVTMGQTRDG